MKKDRFVHFIKHRFFLRFHMALILIGACLFGLAASKILLMGGMTNIVLRYPLTVLLSYGMFFLFIRLWMAYLRSSTLERTARVLDSAGDLVPDAPDVIGNALARGGEVFRGGGGVSGGGGASGIFESTAAASDAADEAGSVVADVAGEIVSGSDDFGPALIVFGVIVMAVFGAGIYLIYDAPNILAEAAFQCVLAGSLLKRAKTIVAPDWVGGVFRSTWIPLAVVLAITIIGSFVIHARYPSLTEMSEIFSSTLGD